MYGMLGWVLLHLCASVQKNNKPDKFVTTHAETPKTQNPKTPKPQNLKT